MNNTINAHATLWVAEDEERGVTEMKFLDGTLAKPDVQVYEKKRCHWERLQHLRENVVPHILDMAHKTLQYNDQYEDTLKELVKELVPLGLRRMVLGRILETDPWLLAGGPAPPNVGDVMDEEEPSAEFDIFSNLLGINGLFDWAMESSLPGV
ncbi:hypothetical protein [Absidia glauca]|uniref:Uncharacterized protein n=1 Tax=Absidia glauca TaxID=4829 RepID=A0A163IXR8_ABSGL|nr:hypothetical protein [Absidia glauca]